MKFKTYLKPKQLKKRFYKKLYENKAVGLDGVRADHFATQLEDEIKIIRTKVKNFSYRFTPFKEKYILKGKHSIPRTVYIPTVRDRLVIGALNQFVGDSFKDTLKPHQKTVQQIIADIRIAIDSGKFDSFLKLDVKNFYPSLDHEILMDKMKTKIQDKKALSVIKKILNRSNEGIAQGLSIAGNLANIYLNEIDSHYSQLTNLKYYRFVDDILIICNQVDAQSIQHNIEQHIRELKLNLHSVEIGGKSEVGSLKADKLGYLGFSFYRDEITVRQASVEKLRKRIRQVFKQELGGETSPSKTQLHELHRRLNLKITGCIYDEKPYGWLFFFNQMNDLTLLYHLDWFVKQTFKSFKVSYQPKKVKSFVKTYYFMKGLQPDKLDKKSYIPKYTSVDDQPKELSVSVKKPKDTKVIEALPIGRVDLDLLPDGYLPKAEELEGLSQFYGDDDAEMPSDIALLLLELQNDIEIYV